MTLQDLLREAITTFTQAGLTGPYLDAEVLLSHCLGRERLFLYTNPDFALTDEQVRLYRDFVVRRLSKEPVAYIIGHKEFWSLSLEVDHRTLIPRPETEILIEEALKIVAGSDNVTNKILDVGVGSGAISIALASELINARLFAIDISPGAVIVAANNARKLGFGDRIAFVVGDLVHPFSGIFDMIVSNPPYITTDDFESLPGEVRDFEPSTALFGGSDGLSFHRELIRAAESRLKSGGWLLMEIGAGQVRPVEQILRNACLFDIIRFRADYAGIDRVAVARRQ